jgi:3-oxoacyl-[acyl-carrier protein] reductase
LTKSIDDPVTKIEIDGQTIQAGVPASTLGALKAMVPLGRAGTPEEAAGGIYLFCIPESDYISGEIVLVGGGVSL